MRTMALLFFAVVVSVKPGSVEAQGCGIMPIGVLAMGQGCGIMPIKPITPIGCRDLRPVCECDERGKNCRWKWVCVK